MVRTASLFSQLLQQIPRSRFDALIRVHQGGRHAKGFTCYALLTSMQFCQLEHADSLRDICHGSTSCPAKLNHHDVRRALNKSNISYANAHRPAALFEKILWMTLNHFRTKRQLGTRVQVCHRPSGHPPSFSPAYFEPGKGTTEPRGVDSSSTAFKIVSGLRWAHFCVLSSELCLSSSLTTYRST